MKKTLFFFLLICSLCSVAQNFQWGHRLGYSGKTSNGWSSAVDLNGNYIVAGYFGGTAVDFAPGTTSYTLNALGSNDAFLAKYDPSGNILWAFNIGSISNYAIGQGVATDALGYIYTTGYFWGTTDFDPGPGSYTLTATNPGNAYVAKYDPNGNLKWAFKVGNPGSKFFARSLAMDGAGHFYICGDAASANIDFDPGPGTYTLSAATNDAYVAKYDTAANLSWAFIIGGSGTVDIPYKVAVDPKGNVLIGGSFGGGPGVDFDPGSGTSHIFPLGSYDAFLAKYDSGGNYKWVTTFGCASNSNGVSGLAIDNNGSGYVTGNLAGTADLDPSGLTYTLAATGTQDMFLAKYDSSGNFVFAENVGASGKSTVGTAAWFDGSGNILVGGSFSGTIDLDAGTGTASLSTVASGPDAFLVSYDMAGSYQWSFGVGAVVNGSGTTGIRDIVTTSAGNMWITGSISGYQIDMDPGPSTFSVNAAGFYDLMMAEYSMPTTSVATIPAIKEMNVFPNPFDNEIFVPIPGNSEPLKASIYSIDGKLLKETILSSNEERINTEKLPKGIYILKIAGDKFVRTKKIIKN